MKQPTENQQGSAEAELLSRLRDAAVDYAQNGWPIVPISLTGDRLVAGLSPVDAHTAFEWWSDRPYGIGCRVGEQFDALEIPAELGRQVLDRVRRHQLPEPPVIEVPARESWLLLVSPRSPRIPELAPYRQVRLRSKGVWIPLPPSGILGAPTCWINQQGREQLPHSLTMQWTIRSLLRHTQSAAAPTVVDDDRPNVP
jgi:hypothetical protein